MFSVGLIDLAKFQGLAVEGKGYGAIVPCPGFSYSPTGILSPTFIEEQDERRDWLKDNCPSWEPKRESDQDRWLSVIHDENNRSLFIAYPLTLVDATMFLLRWG